MSRSLKGIVEIFTSSRRPSELFPKLVLPSDNPAIFAILSKFKQKEEVYGTSGLQFWKKSLSLGFETKQRSQHSTSKYQGVPHLPPSKRTPM